MTVLCLPQVQGTYSGLWLANKLLNHPSDIYGICVGGDAEYFKARISEILYESMKYMDVNIPVSQEDINIIDGYVGRGYALSRPEELRFIQFFSKLEGIILDPVYTGKAMYGLAEKSKGTFINYKNILLFIPEGFSGSFPKEACLSFKIRGRFGCLFEANETSRCPYSI